MSWRETAECILREVSDNPIRQYSTRDNGRVKYSDAVSVIIPSNGTKPPVVEAFWHLTTVRKNLPPGLLAFLGTSRWYGDEQHQGVELVVAPGESQFDILLIAAADAVNYGIESNDLIKKFKEYDQLCGINILQAEPDRVVIEIKSNPPDMRAFAEDVYAFCPDIVDQGVGSLEKLEEMIDILGEITFWWD